MATATVSLCLDLTNPDAESTPLFYLTEEAGRLSISFAVSFSEMRRLVGRDHITKAVVMDFPWLLAHLHEEHSSGKEFVPWLAHTLRHSSLYVSDIGSEP
jgi:hypothetical protein